MSSPHSQAPLTGGYDQSLLAAAPVATKAAKQEGYNVDLLDQGRHRSTQPPPRTTDVEASRGMKENYLSPVREPRRKLPFWRTRAGILVLAVGAVIIIGAVVGGAVGGSVGRKNHNNKAAPGLKSGTSSDPTGNQPTKAAGPQPPGQQTEPASTPPGAGKPLSSLPSGGAITLPTGLPTGSPLPTPQSNGGTRR